MRSISILLFVGIGAGLCAGGCGNGFDPANYVSSLRLIDVKAEPAEVPGGGMTQMTAYWANPGKSTPNIEWDYCTLQNPPGSGTDFNTNCFTNDLSVDFLKPIGSGEMVSFTMPVVPLSQLGFPDSSDGFYFPIRVQLSDATEVVNSVFNLRYYPGSNINPNTPNENPSIMGIFKVPYWDAGAAAQMEIVDGTPLTVHNNDKIDMRALLTADSAETYKVLSGNPPMITTKTETVSMTWLATAGEFSQDTTGEAKPNTTWTLDKDLPAAGVTTIDLWVVARDERGGSDVLHRTFNSAD